MSGRNPDSIEACLNGERRTFRRGTSIAELVEHAWGRGVAVARNGEVLPRAAWPTTHVEPEDEIEIVRPIQGG
jgi:sulfur carrier protein